MKDKKLSIEKATQCGMSIQRMINLFNHLIDNAETHEAAENYTRQLNEFLEIVG